ncbi:MAG: hypothetical protein GXY48_09925 [Methanomicrobiales archaeon]|nr:hypothetical protein [Methanomicrobiales archaeon]
MLERIRNLISKKPEPKPGKTITLDELPAWLDMQEQNCIAERSIAIKASRERIITFEQDLRQLLNEFGEESVDEPHHHKVEQVNRHALPQFCKKIDSELEGDFSDDDEVFYQEVAGLMNGCFKAFKGPGRYLHHLYPEEIKEFRLTLDNMGHELNRMTDIIKNSREHLSHLQQVRDAFDERNEMIREFSRASEEQDKYKSTLLTLNENMENLQSDLTKLTSSSEYLNYTQLEEDIQKSEEQLHQHIESYESHLRNAVPVWKRAGKIFQEKGDDDHEKNMEDLVHMASAPRRQDDEIAQKVNTSARALFSLFENGSLQAKNTFEKHLFTTPDEYTVKLSQSVQNIHTISDDLKNKLEKRENSSVLEKKTEFNRLIENVGHEIRKVRDEESIRIERMSSMEEKMAKSLKNIQEKFDECCHDGSILVEPEKTDE